MRSLTKRCRPEGSSCSFMVDETVERSGLGYEHRQQQTTRLASASVRSLRRPRQGMDVAEARRLKGSLQCDEGSARDSDGRAEAEVEAKIMASAAARAWFNGRPSTDGSGCWRSVLPLTAYSFLLFSCLSDPTAAFQPVNPPVSPRIAVRDPRKQLRAYALCHDFSYGVLVQGSFTGRLGHQGRRGRGPYVWGQGWPSNPVPRGTLEVTPTGGMGGGDWIAGGPSGGSMRGRGGGRARRSAEAPTGAREAHATAQAPIYDGYSRSATTSTVDLFPDIVEALSCYKRVHGHVKILPTFKVPASVPWPENVWGMELGKLVYKLRNEKDVYRGQYPDRMTLLKNMGFEWEHSAVPQEWDLIITGIEAFFRINGHSRVPTRYVVPAEEPWPMEVWGHKLGSRIAQMRQTGRYLGDNEETIEERKAILDKLGFEWRLRVHEDDAQDESPEEFTILCEALQIYRDLGGSVPNMPPTFVIPNADPWPLRTRGFPLGNQVRLVRSRQKYAKDSKENADQLVALGVPIRPTVGDEYARGRSGGPTETRFDKLCRALEMFVHLYGHTQVPVNFEVPRVEPWPVLTWGVKLGTSLTNIVTKGTFIKGHPDRQARLEALGFDTDPGGVRGFKERVARGISPEEAMAQSQAAINFVNEGRQQPKQEGTEAFLVPSAVDNEDTMDSQALLGSVMDSLRSEESRRGAALGATESTAPLSPPPEPMPFEKRVSQGEIEEATGLPSWSSQQQQQRQEKPAWEREDLETGDRDKNVPPSFMKQEFTDEERAAFSNDADLRYWPKETQHPAVRKMIPLLGHLARGSQEVAQLDGPVGTEMVTLPGVLQPGEWEITRKKEELDLGYMERQEDGYLEHDDQDDHDDETGVIDRTKGRRIKKGCSTAASALHWCPEEIREHILEVDFEWDEFCDGFRWEDVIKGLKLYKTLYDELPDDDFKVPVDYEWPRELSGMKLGPLCRQMRIGDIWAKHEPSRRKVLDELGFDWGDDKLYLDFQWPEVVVVLYSVLKLKGHLDIPAHYVIPEEDPWPLPIRGYPAGFCLNIARAQKDLLMEHYPDRYEILRGMGLMWSEPILVDWEEEDERDREENEWRRWGYMPVDEEEENISVDPEFGLKDTDPLL